MTSLLIGKQARIRARASETKPSLPMYSGLNAEETKLQKQADKEFAQMRQQWREDSDLECGTKSLVELSE
jgi:hypothetical protein